MFHRRCSPVFFHGVLVRAGRHSAYTGPRGEASTLGKGADLKLLLPPAAGQSAMMGKAQFRQTAGRLSLMFEGQLDFSDEQTKQFASQLKQRLSAQETSTR